MRTYTIRLLSGAAHEVQAASFTADAHLASFFDDTQTVIAAFNGWSVITEKKDGQQVEAKADEPEAITKLRAAIANNPDQ